MKTRVDLLIKTSASAEIGHGHVVRCRALAREARRQGLKVGFEARDAYTARLLESLGETVEPRSDLLRPALVIRDFRGGSALEAVRRDKARGGLVLLLDDHGPARTLAHLVADAFLTPAQAQGLPHGPETRYLYGLDYSPLAEEFGRTRKVVRPAGTAEPRLLICFGGADPRGVTLAFVRGLHLAGFRGPALIVAEEEHRREVAALTATWSRTEILPRLVGLAQAMAESDLVATKIGLMVSEAFCLGRPCVLVEPSPAHLDLEAELQAHYPAWPALELGLAEGLDLASAGDRTMDLLYDEPRLRSMSGRAAGLVDGLGCQRIIQALLKAGESGQEVALGWG